MNKYLIIGFISLILIGGILYALNESKSLPDAGNDSTNLPDSSEQINYEEKAPQEECYIGGCSSQVCSDQPGVASTCEFREEYACYRTAKCERQGNGQCGWTVTPELSMCLNSSKQ